jgi:hypothetical protein
MATPTESSARSRGTATPTVGTAGGSSLTCGRREASPAGPCTRSRPSPNVAPVTSPRGRELCDWLASVSFADGGVAFALPITNTAGSAPFWVDAEHQRSSLHITSAVAAAAHRVARHDPAVRDHPWLAGATRYCFDTIAAWDDPMNALELLYSLQFLDAASSEHEEAARLIARLGTGIPADGLLGVEGGLESEFVRPLDIAPEPGRPVRALFPPDVVVRELDRLEGQQREDGGWDVDFLTRSPAAELDWRGYATVFSLSILQNNGRL